MFQNSEEEPKTVATLENHESLMTKIPFSYYNSQLLAECSLGQEANNSKETQIKKESEEKCLKDKIESQIKTKYNLVIPAILIEIQENGLNSIKLLKEDLRTLLTSLGSIKHIEIGTSIAYVLYEHYFSALLAFNILNDIVMKDNKNFVSVRLFTQKEDEEKQKKANCQNQKKSLLHPQIVTGVTLEKNENKNCAEKESFLNSNPFYSQNSLFSTSFFTSEWKAGAARQTKKTEIENEKESLVPSQTNGTSSFANQVNQSLNKAPKEEDLFSESFLEGFSQFGTDDCPQAEDSKNSSFYIDPGMQGAKFTKPHVWSQPNCNPFNFGQLENYPSYYPPNYMGSYIPGNGFPPQIYPGHMFPSEIGSSQFPQPYTGNYTQLKYICNYDVQIENDQKFRVTKRLIGNKGMVLKKILLDSCLRFGDYSTKIRLRGKGSGYKEGTMNIESEDPLQLCVSSLNYETYSRCLVGVETLLKQIYQEFFDFNFQNQNLVDASLKEIVKYEYIVNRY